MKTDWKVGDKFRIVDWKGTQLDPEKHDPQQTVARIGDDRVYFHCPEHGELFAKLSCIEELSDDIEVTPTGGKHTRLDERTDLLPHRAILELSANPLPQGEKKYGRDNWRKIDQRGHLNHAIVHVFKYLIDGKREDLRNAACRLLFAMETE